jgi:hypothetical protein
VAAELVGGARVLVVNATQEVVLVRELGDLDARIGDGAVALHQLFRGLLEPVDEPGKSLLLACERRLLHGDPFLNRAQISNTPCFFAGKIVELGLHRILAAREIGQRHFDLLERTFLARLFAHQVEGQLLVLAQRVTGGLEGTVGFAQRAFTVGEKGPGGVRCFAARGRIATIDLELRADGLEARTRPGYLGFIVRHARA